MDKSEFEKSHVQLSVWVTDKLRDEFRIECIRQKTTMSKVLSAEIKSWLAAKKRAAKDD
jgi:hypothetical protein